MRVLHVWHAPGKKLAAFARHSLKLSLSLADGLLGRVLATREAQWIAEIAQRPHCARRRAATLAGLRSALAFPIAINGQM